MIIRAFLLLCFFLIFIAVALSAGTQCALPRPTDEVQLSDLITDAIGAGCTLIRIPVGSWEVDRPILVESSGAALTIEGESSGSETTIRSRSAVIFAIRGARYITLQNLTLRGGVLLEQTDSITIRSVAFRGAGIDLPGRRCNQPNECNIYNRNIRIENCTFEDARVGIRAERLEASIIQNNFFRSSFRSAGCDSETVAIELNGSTEDLDRPVEYGHNKGNSIVQNTFEVDGATGVRLRETRANILRENRFYRAYRAIELLDDARHNQILHSYISYLSQEPVSSACPKPCAIYLGPGSVNNIFVNNFFEQNVELQFLERNRNRTFVIDESANQNVFRSDFLRLNQ